MAGDRRRLEHRWEPVAWKLEGVEDLGAPVAARDVEEERPRRVRGVDRPFAGQPEPDVVLRQHHACDARVRLGLVTAQPEELGRGEAGQRTVPRQLDQALEPDALLDLGALEGGALVVPEDRGTDHAPGLVEHDETVHLAREADPGDLAPGRHLGERGLGGTQPVAGILLRPARPRGGERVAVGRRREHFTVRRERERLDAGRADVDAD